MKTDVNIKPSNMFHTPENWDELMKMQADFGKRIKGTVGVDFHEIIVDGNKAVVYAKGKMEGVGGKYVEKKRLYRIGISSSLSSGTSNPLK